MIGIVVASHGNMARELLATAENIMGPIEKCETVSVYGGDSKKVISHKVKEAISKVVDGKGIIVLTDIFGGSATNVSYSFCRQYNLRIVSGVNLPILLELATHRKLDDLDRLVALLERTGRASILQADREMKKLHA